MTFPTRFPRQHGRPLFDVDAEHEALLDYLSLGWDIAEETALWAETRAEAYAITAGWLLNRRLANQLVPTRMLDNFVDWETACSLRSGANESTRARRRRLAGKMRGFVGNTISDIEDVARKAAGDRFVALVQATTTNAVSYWPGVNPGPNGFEWSSSFAIACAHLTAGNLNAGQQRRLLDTTRDAMLEMCPAWMTCEAAFGDGTTSGSFVAGVGIAGVTVL